MNATILDVSRTPHVRVTGKIFGIRPQGIIIEDAKGIRYYATNERVLKQETPVDMVTLESNGLW